MCSSKNAVTFIGCSFYRGEYFSDIIIIRLAPAQHDVRPDPLVYLRVWRLEEYVEVVRSVGLVKRDCNKIVLRISCCSGSRAREGQTSQLRYFSQLSQWVLSANHYTTHQRQWHSVLSDEGTYPESITSLLPWSLVPGLNVQCIVRICRGIGNSDRLATTDCTKSLKCPQHDRTTRNTSLEISQHFKMYLMWTIWQCQNPIFYY